jgi:uncharacterized protein YbjT (DUF2867 family)
MKHSRILVIGGSGFIGSRVVTRLSARNCNAIVATRRRDRSRHLILLPTVEVVQVRFDDDNRLAALVARSDAVVNLAGILQGDTGHPYGRQFRDVHVELPKRLAEFCRHAGVRRFVHVSALGIRNGTGATLPSMYLRSKADGEQVLRQAPGLDLTIMRPSVVFGPGDRFLNLFAELQRWFPVLPLARAETRLQPVYVGDVAQAIVDSLDVAAAIGKTYELAGPEVFTLRELVELAGRLSGHSRPIIELTDHIGRLQATALEFAPGPTLMSRDNFDSLTIDNVADHPDPALAADLGFRPQALAAIAPGYLSPADRYGDARRHAHR